MPKQIGKIVDDDKKETKIRKMPIWVILILGLIIVGALYAIGYELWGEPKQEINPNIVLIEDRDIITDFNHDGYADYVKYIYVEIIYGGEEANFQTGTGE
jgi:hypothetical protein